jgi:hypothetical protein
MVARPEQDAKRRAEKKTAPTFETARPNSDQEFEERLSAIVATTVNVLVNGVPHTGKWLGESALHRSIGAQTAALSGETVDCRPGQGVQEFDECLAERLLSDGMDRLAVIAADMSDLAAETAIDLALIEAKRAQIDRAQTENWALLQELTGQTR